MAVKGSNTHRQINQKKKEMEIIWEKGKYIIALINTYKKIFCNMGKAGQPET